MIDREKVIEALRICRENLSTKSCRKCPYMRGRDGTGTCYPIDAEENGVHLCWQDLVDDALALLKEQEPRVITLEEVRRDHYRVVWIECDASKTLNIGQYRGQVYWHNGQVGKWERFMTMSFADDYLHRKSDKYGKTWRCWNARPTEDQMRDTPWEGENDAE